MPVPASMDAADRFTPQGHEVSAYLRLHSVDIFVRDHERSLRFFLDVLGFKLAFDAILQSGLRCVGVRPPHGSAVLNLIEPGPDSPNQERIGSSTRITFVTDDFPRTFAEWTSRGVRFGHAPRLRRMKYSRNDGVCAGNAAEPVWGQVFSRFKDPDGNWFYLVSLDEVSKALETQRRLAAEKAEAEQRAAHEMAIARSVQARLFPQRLPPCSTLRFAGKCAQARQVGGDYFDFFPLGDDRVSLILSDVAGKGMPAALLMANLQANLRSQALTAATEPKRFLESVNQLFCENTAESAYATLFFADYSGVTRHLRYVNCGHLSGLLLRESGRVEWLESTCTVLGLFSAWQCCTAECSLSAGDTLVLYTDGITETFNEAGEEFGEHRVLRAVESSRDLPPEELIEAVLEEVRSFGDQEQQDDMTLVVAKAS